MHAHYKGHNLNNSRGVLKNGHILTAIFCDLSIVCKIIRLTTFSMSEFSFLNLPYKGVKYWALMRLMEGGV